MARNRRRANGRPGQDAEDLAKQRAAAEASAFYVKRTTKVQPSQFTTPTPEVARLNRVVAFAGAKLRTVSLDNSDRVRSAIRRYIADLALSLAELHTMAVQLRGIALGGASWASIRGAEPNAADLAKQRAAAEAYCACISVAAKARPTDFESAWERLHTVLREPNVLSKVERIAATRRIIRDVQKMMAGSMPFAKAA